MGRQLETEIKQIIKNEMAALNRPDLFRLPLVSFSDAGDKRYSELKEIIGEWHLSPFELLPDAGSVISYFVPFTEAVVSEPKKVKDGSVLWAEAYEVINGHFGRINEALSEYLTGLGYSAKTIPATHTYDPKDMKCKWSHRSAAAISGLGTFGINRLLITEKGSGGRFCSVITSAPLKAEQNFAQVKCLETAGKSCGLCHKICPARAFAGEDIDKFACYAELTKNRNELMSKTALNSVDVCGQCISICPYAYIE